MSHDLLERFLPLLATRTGLHVRDKDRATLARALEARVRESGLSPEEYWRALMRDTAMEGEWKKLLPRLTNGESYFLRDKGQIALLRDRLLPELLEMRKNERSLRVWSAGCSTGEEVYTLAMLISELLPRHAEWRITIIGTDINEEALDKARRGVYGTWAFRAVPDEVRTRYFEQGAQGLEIKSELRGLVRFALLNLRGEGFPNRAQELADFDLILCRNVLIYFDREAIAHTLRGFAASLRDGGYLLTGHAELTGHDPAPLVVRAYTQSVAYQKTAAVVAAPERFVAVKSSGNLRPTAPRVALRPPDATAPISTVLRAPAPPNIAAKAPAAKAPDLHEQARAAANAGKYEDAVRLCREAIAWDATDAAAYALWAHVEDEQGDAAAAKGLWKKVIYLAPSQPEAYVELGALYEREGDFRRARQMRESALALLHKGAAPERDAMARHLEELLVQQPVVQQSVKPPARRSR